MSRSKTRKKRTHSSVAIKDTDGLNPRQRRFVEEYVIDCNASRAAKVAGYKTGPTIGSILLATPAVAAVVKQKLDALREKCELTAEMVLEQLIYGVTRDGKDFVDKNGRIQTNLNVLPRRVTAMIDSIEQEVSYDGEGNEKVKTKLRLVSKATCIELAMKHKGLFEPERHQHQHVTLDLNQLFQSQEQYKDESTIRLEQEALLCEPEPESTNLPRESDDSNSMPKPSGTNGSSLR